MRKLILLVLCTLMLLALPACSKKSELRQVTLNEVTRSVFYAPLYAAITKGFFAEEGMEITIVTGGGSDKTMTALLSGEAEIGLAGPETGVSVTTGTAGFPLPFSFF